MKKLLLLLLSSMAVCAYSEPVSFVGTDGFQKDVSAAQPLPMTGTVTGTMSATITGSPSVKIIPYTTASSTNVTLTPNVSYTLPTFPNLRFTSIVNNSDTGEFWAIQKSGTAAINYGRRVYLNVSIGNENPEPVSIISSTAITISFDQKGY